MAADTREDLSRNPPPPEHVKSPSSQDTTHAKFVAPMAPENANILPGGHMNTAGGQLKETTIIEAVKTIKLEDFKEVHRKPCARDALLIGIGAGFGVGGMRAIIGGPSWFLFFLYGPICLTDAAPTLKACSWAVATFCFGAFVSHEFCQRKRLLELQGLKRAVEVMDRKKNERQTRVD